MGEINMQCETCDYFDTEEGHCRRYPPVVIDDTRHQDKYLSVFPGVRPEWGCGEYSVKIYEKYGRKEEKE